MMRPTTELPHSSYTVSAFREWGKKNQIYVMMVTLNYCHFRASSMRFSLIFIKYHDDMFIDFIRKFTFSTLECVRETVVGYK